jgi:hypothetical protein
VGASVEHLSDLGGGVPDLLVGWHEINMLFECKDEARPPSERRLTLLQTYWHNMWRGQVTIVESPDQAVAIAEELAHLQAQMTGLKLHT